jgi:hypothetical protein
METRDFLDAAIAAADAGGGFCPEQLSRKLKITRAQRRTLGVRLEEMKLVSAGTGRWQLVGAAGDLARALNGGNVSRAPSRS